MQEMPQNSKGVQGDWLPGTSMQELQPQVMSTSPLEGCFTLSVTHTNTLTHARTHTHTRTHGHVMDLSRGVASVLQVCCKCFASVLQCLVCLSKNAFCDLTVEYVHEHAAKCCGVDFVRVLQCLVCACCDL